MRDQGEEPKEPADAAGSGRDVVGAGVDVLAEAAPLPAPMRPTRGAGGALGAAAHRYAHGAIGKNAAAPREVGLARIGDAAVGDSHLVAIGLVARALGGIDETLQMPGSSR